MNSVLRLADSCCSLVRSWLAVDRIRVKPIAGRLLQLQPGQTILLCGELLQITSRTDSTTEQRAVIEYLLDCNGAHGTLTVCLSYPKFLATGQLVFPDRIIDVLEDDVVLVRTE